MNTMLRKTVHAFAGFAFAGGALLGPTTAALASPAHEAPATAAPATVAVAQVKTDKPAPKPGMDKLSPHGVQGQQSSVKLSDEQTKNAKAIIEATKKSGMDERAAVVAIATSLQESKLDNLGHLGDMNDHDSLGLFQQRPSSGWGSAEQITNPEYSTKAFLSGLKNVEGWKDMPLTDAAQAVQVSAYPDHYAQWETQAANLVADHWNS
ncbi:hypothetical protein ACFQ1L_27265 [Phytohabitans flavus]|uniref:Secreted protein n=1 Tax=Phytohabitans flavus TaxID=1076124 RepID=A0A6F8XQW6_9ACTN|nr:hypothetical protein [Phytohabitans flavus]BCB76210.1 hypothetical protein Pflav_026200 [Phytohabitans flavus]